MSLTFTFFDDVAFLQGGAHVYVGKVKEEGADLIAYRIKMKNKEFWLYDGKPKDFGRRELLHGNFDGGFGFYGGTSGIIRGYNSVTDFNLSGFFSNALKFVDGHTGRKYKWKSDMMGSSWDLKDADKNLVATFDRHRFKMTRHGELTIYQANIPEHLLGLILVTHKLYHNIILRAEQRRRTQHNH